MAILSDSRDITWASSSEVTRTSVMRSVV